MLTEKCKSGIYLAIGLVLFCIACLGIASYIGGCANTGEAIGDIRLMVQEQRAAINRYEARGGENAETLRQVLTTAEAATASIEAIKEAEIEDLKTAAMAAGKAGANSLLGPGGGELAFGGIASLVALFAGRKALTESKAHTELKVAKALATPPPPGGAI